VKILHIIAQLPHCTGSGIYFRNCVEEFGVLGFEQRALFATQDGFEFDALDSKYQYHVAFKTDELPFPVAGMSDIMPYESTVYSLMTEDMLESWSTAFRWQMQQARSEFMPDVVFLHHLWIVTSLALHVFPNQFKLAFCHNTDLRQARQHPEMKSRHVNNLDMLDLVFALSDEQAVGISHEFGIDSKKIVPLGGAVDQRIFYPRPDRARERSVKCSRNITRKLAEPIRIAYAGKIERSKGIFELVAAFKQALKSEGNMHLSIMGTLTKESKEQLRDHISDCESIELIEVENQDELADRLRQQDIFVMPSFYEGLGLVAVESLACGLRVVATEIEALMSQLGDRINASDVIEYVTMPGIYDTDKPIEEDIPAFIDRLGEALLLQASRIRADTKISPEIQEEIKTHTWTNLSARINGILHQSRAHERSDGYVT
jgi:glycosyltransferase involved in cell wall biosynthesis